MRIRGKRVRTFGLLATIVIVVLSGLGFGYASWTEQLDINGTVQTGTLDAQWLTFPVVCSEDDPVGVATVTAVRDSTDFSLMHFTITNAYPGYLGYCAMTWKNSGTLPAMISSLDVNGGTVDSSVSNDFNFAGSIANDLAITFWDGVDSSYPVGDGDAKVLQVKVLPGAPEGTPITFTAHVNFVIGANP